MNILIALVDRYISDFEEDSNQDLGGTISKFDSNQDVEEMGMISKSE